MSSRALILNRIQTALRRGARRPTPSAPDHVFTRIPSDNLLSRFEKEFTALRGIFYRATDPEAARAWLLQISSEHGWKRIATSPECDAAKVGRILNAMVLTGEGDCGKQLDGIDLGITTCECLLAFTGSVVLTSQSGFGRTLSILPPAHLVVARRSQLLADLGEAYRQLHNRHARMWPSMISIITGPSRTADIEKIIVLGAHGPRKLFLLLLDY